MCLLLHTYITICHGIEVLSSEDDGYLKDLYVRIVELLERRRFHEDGSSSRNNVLG